MASINSTDSIKHLTVAEAVNRDRPHENAALVVPTDSTDLSPYAVRLFVGGAGNIKVTTWGGNTLVLTGIPAGTLLPLSVVRVWSTSTTASNIVALFD